MIKNLKIDLRPRMPVLIIVTQSLSFPFRYEINHDIDSLIGRAKRAEVEQQVLELQVQEEEHLLELNTGQSAGTRQDGRRQAPRAASDGPGARTALAVSDGDGAAGGEGNRSAVLDALRQKLTEAQDFNLQLEQRLRRAEETLEAVKTARPTDSQDSNATSRPSEAATPAPSNPVPVAAAAPPEQARDVEPSPQSVPSDIRQPWGPERQGLPVPAWGDGFSTEQRSQYADYDRRRRTDDEVLAHRLAALVPLDASSPGAAAPQLPPPRPPSWPPRASAEADPRALRGYDPRAQRWEHAGEEAARSPARSRMQERGGGGASWDRDGGDAWGRYPRRQAPAPMPPPAPRRAEARRREARGHEEEYYYEDSVERWRGRERLGSREPVRTGPGRRESRDDVDERGRREEDAGDRARPRRRRGERGGRRLGGGEADAGAGEVERLLAAAGLSGYEGVLLRNGWDCMARLRLIKEADLVRRAAAAQRRIRAAA